MTVWPFLFYRTDAKIDAATVNHEYIHARQQMEMLVIPFFVWYLVEWIVRTVFGGGNSYRRISFEREAYENQSNMEYLSTRRFWSWMNYF